MIFPITRERLQNYVKEEAIADHIKERVHKELDTIKKLVEQTVLLSSGTKARYDIPRTVRDGIVYSQNGRTKGGMHPGILQELLIELHNLLPDCTIQMDPLQTYILIDWS
jgi:hypothetical protein